MSPGASSQVWGGMYCLPKALPSHQSNSPVGPYHFVIGSVVCYRKDSLAPTGDVVQIKQHCHVAVRQGDC